MSGDEKGALQIDLVADRGVHPDRAFVSVTSPTFADHGHTSEGKISFTVPQGQVYKVAVNHPNFHPLVKEIPLRAKGVRQSLRLQRFTKERRS